MASSTTASLANALSSLRTSTQTLDTSLQILDSGISDLPRLSKVLSQTRHFELLPSSTLNAAQTSLRAEIRPEVEALLARVEAQVERLERREQGLLAKYELQAGRLGKGEDPSSAAGGDSRWNRNARGAGANTGATKAGSGAGSAALGARQELKAKQLRQKKERLSYAVDRLTLQAQQTERKLRMSMAAQEKSMGASGAGEDVDDDDDNGSVD